jgi:isoaspartyl peptidase/L-asparaginase-like protein (Ntn-hydrolase superfamily)
MQKSRHVMMVGQGAEAFAVEQGITLVDPSYFRTEKRWQQLQRALKEEANGQAHADLRPQSTSVPSVRSHWMRRGSWPPAPPRAA